MHVNITVAFLCNSCSVYIPHALESIVGSAADADMGLIMGIGFPVFRGGAMRYIDQMGVKAFVEMADRYADLGKLYQVTDSLREMAAKGESFFK